MKYEQPYGVSDPNAPYINGDPSIGRPGSIPPAAAIEYPQREIIAMINAGGFTPSDADLQQLARAIQSGKVIYGLDTGAGNNYSVTLNPPLLAYSDGLALWIVPQLSNTGPATLNCNALGARNIVRRGGDPLAAGDMPGGYKSLVTFNALHNNFELYGSSFTGAGGTGFIPILTANTNLYVNAATGDDTLYDGTAPTISGPHGPFKTIMRAINETFKYGPSVFTMTINVAAGTYNESVIIPQVTGPTTIIQGAGMSSTIVNNTTDSCFVVRGPNNIIVQNLRANVVNNPGGFSLAHWAAYLGATIRVKNCLCGSINSALGWSFFAYSGYVFCDTGNHIVAGANYGSVFAANYNGVINIGAPGSLTLDGALTVANFANAGVNGVIAVYGPSWSFPGAGGCTGPKYLADMNGAIYTFGAGGSFFPGSVAGSLARGGQYG
jgi:hypothetical protein